MYCWVSRNNMIMHVRSKTLIPNWGRGGVLPHRRTLHAVRTNCSCGRWNPDWPLWAAPSIFRCDVTSNLVPTYSARCAYMYSFPVTHVAGAVGLYMYTSKWLLRISSATTLSLTPVQDFGWKLWLGCLGRRVRKAGRTAGGHFIWIRLDSLWLSWLLYHDVLGIARWAGKQPSRSVKVFLADSIIPNWWHPPVSGTVIVRKFSTNDIHFRSACTPLSIVFLMILTSHLIAY